MTDDGFIDRTEYPPGVPCWIDTEQPDPDAAARFYGGLFGWDFEDKLPPGSADRYLVASLHGHDVAAIGSPTPGISGPPAWHTYVSVVDVDASAARAVALGAQVSMAPTDVGPPGARAGRWAAPDRSREGADPAVAARLPPRCPTGQRAGRVELQRPDDERRGPGEGLLRAALRVAGGPGRLRRRRRDGEPSCGDSPATATSWRSAIRTSSAATPSRGCRRGSATPSAG